MATSDGVQVTVKPSLKDLKKRQEKQLKKIADMKEPMSKVATLLDRWVQTNFKTEGGNVGGWAPFAIGGRRKKGGRIDTTAKLLQDTGRTRASFLPFSSKNDAGIGSDLPHTKAHNEGHGNLPKRRMLPKAADVLKEVRRLLESYHKRILSK